MVTLDDTEARRIISPKDGWSEAELRWCVAAARLAEARMEDDTFLERDADGALLRGICVGDREFGPYPADPAIITGRGFAIVRYDRSCQTDGEIVSNTDFSESLFLVITDDAILLF